eukprot:454460_1
MTNSTKLISPFHEMKPISSSDYELAKPVYYGKNGNYIFIPSESHSIGNIWKYDLDKQTITEEYKYSELQTDIAPGIIGIDNDIIYAITSYETLVSFDLKTKQQVASIYKNDDISHFGACNVTFILSPINEIHFTMDNTHYKLDKQNKCIIKLQENIGALHDDIYDNMSKFVYSSLTKQLFMFQENCKYILCCEINEKNQESANWKKLEIELPKFAEQCNDIEHEVILVWNRIIFWFYHCEIWCLDLFYSNKWYKSNYSIPALFKPGHECAPLVVNDKENNIHFILENIEEKHKHYKALSYDLLPTEIIQLNKIEFDPLVIGFIKQGEKNKQYPFVPIYLKKLVLE